MGISGPFHRLKNREKIFRERVLIRYVIRTKIGFFAKFFFDFVKKYKFFNIFEEQASLSTEGISKL